MGYAAADAGPALRRRAVPDPARHCLGRLRGSAGASGVEAATTAGTPLVVWDDWARDPRMVGQYAARARHDHRLRDCCRSAIGFVVLSLAMLMSMFWWFGVPLLRSMVIAVLTTAFIYVGS